MSDDLNGTTPILHGPLTEPTPEPVVPAPVPEPVAEESAANHHAEAGRKGANRIHQLIRLGRLYEQEHGLKRGRQRLRQLIEQGKLYEQEHGLRPRRRREPRLSKQQAIQEFLRATARLVKPPYRGELLALVEALEGRPEPAPERIAG
jgi:hypothetical protein